MPRSPASPAIAGSRATLDSIDFGLKPGDELKVETTICHEIRQHQETVAIDHVEESAVYCGHPTAAMYGFQSYISTPIFLEDGSFFGTLCAIDPLPAKVDNPQVIGMFKLFAELIARHLDADRRMVANEQTLSEQFALSELRERFVGVLGHDLRNPLASLQAGIKMIRRRTEDEGTLKILMMMQNSIDRMLGLVGNVMDLTRGRLGGGIKLEIKEIDSLQSDLMQVVDEFRSAAPERMILTDLHVTSPVKVDKIRLGQLLSNLVGNALAHGDPDREVRVEAKTRDGQFELAVENHGTPIPAEVLPRLFEPFSQSADNAPQVGLGLGLYIASEIAKAHGGQLNAHSTPEKTRFTLTMPAA
ncbi:GAF domain-containing sensor histidine kinase [Rhizobium sp. TH2]|uniref:GAF domain-containing sensor histidine kinase n=1 Tax=Rhizobium sp. TH2 TaxID=2775403 RepID=UPI00280B199B|nr:GAF domain-containing sensor histidine kinase [Rhizobium sp. TH2]